MSEQWHGDAAPAHKHKRFNRCIKQASEAAGRGEIDSVRLNMERARLVAAGYRNLEKLLAKQITRIWNKFSKVQGEK